mmetsp:Transcript_32596/g.59940  ORF Transcript_32596/g.59940 Transcript_32596/m.59940 type:complete len:207 (-) Transcript_32596:572-1192(-)
MTEVPCVSLIFGPRFSFTLSTYSQRREERRPEGGGGGFHRQRCLSEVQRSGRAHGACTVRCCCRRNCRDRRRGSRGHSSAPRAHAVILRLLPIPLAVLRPLRDVPSVHLLEEPTGRTVLYQLLHGGTHHLRVRVDQLALSRLAHGARRRSRRRAPAVHPQLLKVPTAGLGFDGGVQIQYPRGDLLVGEKAYECVDVRDELVARVES